MVRLLDLEPQFLRFEWSGVRGQGARYVEGIEEANGVSFLCPKCFVANSGPIGTHGVRCWSGSRGVPPEAVPGPGRWGLAGSGLHDLSLVPDVPGQAHSVQLLGGCRWHGFVTNGECSLG